MAITLELSLKQLPEFVETLKKVSKDKPEKYLIEVRDRLVDSVDKNFVAQGRYKTPTDLIGGRRKWNKLSKPYRDWKRKHGYGSKIGTRTGALRGSIRGIVNAKNNNVTIESDVKYAPFFDRKRPFLVVQPADIDFMKRTAAKYMRESLREATRKSNKK
jgi:hypothetical protein